MLIAWEETLDTLAALKRWSRIAVHPCQRCGVPTERPKYCSWRCGRAAFDAKRQEDPQVPCHRPETLDRWEEHRALFETLRDVEVAEKLNCSREYARQIRARHFPDTYCPRRGGFSKFDPEANLLQLIRARLRDAGYRRCPGACHEWKPGTEYPPAKNLRCTECGRRAAILRHHTPRGKKYARDYHKTEAYREYHRKYRQTDKYIQAHRLRVPEHPCVVCETATTNPKCCSIACVSKNALEAKRMKCQK